MFLKRKLSKSKFHFLKYHSYNIFRMYQLHHWSFVQSLLKYMNMYSCIWTQRSELRRNGFLSSLLDRLLLTLNCSDAIFKLQWIILLLVILLPFSNDDLAPNWAEDFQANIEGWRWKWSKERMGPSPESF